MLSTFAMYIFLHNICKALRSQPQYSYVNICLFSWWWQCLVETRSWSAKSNLSLCLGLSCFFDLGNVGHLVGNKTAGAWSRPLAAQLHLYSSTRQGMHRYKSAFLHDNIKVVYFLLGISPASNCSWPTFIPPPSTPTHLPWTAHYLMPPFPIGPASSS